MTTFSITTSHTGHTVATLEYDRFFDVWLCSPHWCDMSLRDKPVDGYTFKAPGEWVSVHRAGFHEALLRLEATEGRTTISIRGVRYLRRLRDDPVPPPQDMTTEPLAEAGGSLIGRRHD